MSLERVSGEQSLGRERSTGAKTSSDIAIKLVSSKAEWNDFLDVPVDIYKNDPNYVPQLRAVIREQLDVKKHPYYKHAYMHPIVAYKGGKPVGRAVGFIDEDFNRFHQERTAFFGFFDCINDQEVSNALIEKISRWAREWGMLFLRGPVHLSSNYELGLLVDGFDNPPNVQMLYNPKYYIDLLERDGFYKAKDLLAYDIAHNAKFSDRLLRRAEALKKKESITFRPMDMKNFKSEVEKVQDIYNDAWSKNWGFVPLNDEEFKFMVKDFKAIIDPEIVLMCEVRGEPAGWGLALPDLNQAFGKVKDGKLTPMGLFNLLWHLKGPGRKKINRARILTVGIKKKFLALGLGPLFFTEYLKRLGARYKAAEASWILEDNRPMVKAAEMMKGELTKRYRIYEKPLIVN